MSAEAVGNAAAHDRGADASTDRSYFESMYAGSADPWDFEASWYEQRKYDVTMAALPRQRYRSVLEPGCSNGALSERLATRCDELFAHDFIDDVVERARRRLAGHSHVHVLQANFPFWWPPHQVDLIVWSEVAYYLGTEDGEVALDGARRFLEPGGDLISVHYTGDTNYPRRGASIGPWLDEVSWLDRLVTHDDEGFSLGVWRRTDEER